jgi:SAM-dependent methyltransferase
MGISINIASQLARIAPMVAGCRRGIMLGRQKMHFAPAGWAQRLVDDLAGLGIEATQSDLFQEDGFCESFLRTIGWPPLESLDFSAIEGAEYVHDLNLPVGEDLKERFDLIYDGGTTEHVFDIAEAFRNVDRMLADDGIFVSCVGSDGWFGHGFYQIGPDVPWRYWVASLGYRMLGCWTISRKGRQPPCEVPDPTRSARGAEHRFDRPQFLFYAVQKQAGAPRTPAVVQSHYVQYPTSTQGDDGER